MYPACSSDIEISHGHVKSAQEKSELTEHNSPHGNRENEKVDTKSNSKSSQEALEQPLNQRLSRGNGREQWAIGECYVGEDTVHDDGELEGWHLGSQDVDEPDVSEEPDGADAV